MHLRKRFITSNILWDEETITKTRIQELGTQALYCRHVRIGNEALRDQKIVKLVHNIHFVLSSSFTDRLSTLKHEPSK